jgi:hypothetical protein
MGLVASRSIKIIRLRPRTPARTESIARYAFCRVTSPWQPVLRLACGLFPRIWRTKLLPDFYQRHAALRSG